MRPKLLLLAAAASPLATAERMLLSNSLNSCQEDSAFTASHFNVVYTPNNNSATVKMHVTSTIEGDVMFDVAISAYGYTFFRKPVDPCDMKLDGLCPMVPGKSNQQFNLPIDPESAKQIPAIAFTIPDLDANVRIFVNKTSSDKKTIGSSVSCLEASISNGKTVNLTGVKWATAVIAALALLSSAVFNGLGHFNAAAHVAANSLSLFSFFQAQAIIGLTSVPLPPIVQAWTLNFQWSMGIIRSKVVLGICTWYQRATGGTPSRIFSALSTVSVHVTKRSLDAADKQLVKRGDITHGETGAYTVYGIQRVAFQSKIKSTDLFMTGLIFFYLLFVITGLAVASVKGILELCRRKKWTSRFIDFRNGWRTIIKGIFYRLALLTYPQMSILCLWEFTQADSAAEVVIAVVIFFGLTSVLFWGASRLILIARRSVTLHQNPAYILFADPKVLNKWGFLYIQFRASAYYFIFPTLGYILVKSMLVALGQHCSRGIAQAVGIFLLETGALIAASIMRPWMDKSTNSFNIAICAVNFLNAICLLVFTNVLGAPGLVVGVFSIIFFILNASFSLVLLILLLVTTTLTFFQKNPDARYQIMGDDRASFVKSTPQVNATMELEALAATARGEKLKGTQSKEERESLFRGHRQMGYREASPSAVYNRSGSSLSR